MFRKDHLVLLSRDTVNKEGRGVGWGVRAGAGDESLKTELKK